MCDDLEDNFIYSYAECSAISQMEVEISPGISTTTGQNIYMMISPVEIYNGNITELIEMQPIQNCIFNKNVVKNYDYTYVLNEEEVEISFGEYVMSHNSYNNISEPGLRDSSFDNEAFLEITPGKC